MKRSAMSLLSAILLLGAGSASAQTVPEGQSCGGLLCDMGVLGHKVEAAPTPQPAAAAPQATAVAAPVEPAVPVKPKKRRIAKAVPREIAAERASPAKSMVAKSSVAKPAVAKSSVAKPAVAKAVVARQTVVGRTETAARAVPAAAAPAPAPDINLTNPWDAGGTAVPQRQPAAVMFHPIYQ